MFLKVGNRIINTLHICRVTLYDGPNSASLRVYYAVANDDGMSHDQFKGPEADALRSYFANNAFDLISDRVAPTYRGLAAFHPIKAEKRKGAESC